MDVRMGNSGELSTNKQILDVSGYYKGLIIVNTLASVSNVTIHNCSSEGTPSADNMVAELSLPAVQGDCKVDNPTGVIDCPKGIRAIVVAGSVKYHVRYSALPG